VSARAPSVLVVAGHDPSYRGPSGGAGVDADKEALSAHGVEARVVVTAWTEQDGERVHALRARPAEEWLAEAREVLSVAPVHALKSGLLPDSAAVHAFAALVAEARARDPALPVVVDPVLAASGGEVFLDSAGIEALRRLLLPLGVVLTPNLPEAERLTGRSLARLQASYEMRLVAAEDLLSLGAGAVVLKGGHADDDPAFDLVFARGASPLWLPHPRRPGARLHGSGCRFASTLAAGLALGRPLPAAATAASTYLARLLAPPGA
jgi:hydroxymethylpyrimidine/phosphomethylpyrimidine kinase